ARELPIHGFDAGVGECLACRSDHDAAQGYRDIPQETGTVLVHGTVRMKQNFAQYRRGAMDSLRLGNFARKFLTNRPRCPAAVRVYPAASQPSRRVLRAPYPPAL